MKTLRAGWVRRSLRQIHLWVGLGLGLAIIPICLSGAVLVFGSEVDRFFTPSRYAVTSAAAEQPAGRYLAAAAAAAAAPGTRPIALRWPQEEGAPVIVMMRGGPSGRTELAYLDPPTAGVLGVADSRSSVVGFTHSLHANLMAEDFGGRQIVGWVGLFLLAMTLTGVYLWWPRSTGFVLGLRWRRSPRLSGNLHYSLGFWIAGPLAVMILTGAYLSFPQQGRALIGAFAELTPQAPRPRPNLDPAQRPTQDPQRIVELALRTGEGLRPVSLSPPAQQSKAWRVQVAKPDGETQTVLVDDASSAVTIQGQASAGDAFAAWLRKVHDAKHHGPVWRIAAFLCGVVPAVLAVTGPIMWLRRRASPAPSLARAAAGLAPRQRARWTPRKKSSLPKKKSVAFRRAETSKPL